jgi:hypothetical protein
MLYPSSLHYFADELRATRFRALRRCSSAAAMAVFACLATLLACTGLHAQPRELVTVPLNRPQVVTSKATLWQNASYRWTVTGGGNIGPIGVQTTIIGTIGPVSIDARYVRSSLNLPTFPLSIKIPLDDNGAEGLRYCTVNESVTMAMMPPTTVISTRGTCNIFLATNALGGVVSRLFPSPTDNGITALSYKPFRFIPDNDSRPDSQYVATVAGANLPARFLFVERLGENSNVEYNNNITTFGEATSFSVAMERLTPELTMTERRRLPNGKLADYNLTDTPTDVPATTAPRRRDTVDFGSTFLTLSANITRVLRNRGIRPLSIINIARPSNPAFAVSLSGNVSAGSPAGSATLQRDTDSLKIDLVFAPRVAQGLGVVSDSLVILTNDSTLTPRAGEGYTYTIYLRGTSVNGSLEPSAGPAVTGRTISLPSVRVGESASGVDVLLQNKGLNPLVIQQILRPDSTSPFEVRPFPLPQTLARDENILLPVSFLPRSSGNFEDYVILRGSNFPDLTLVLRGTGVQPQGEIRYKGRPTLRDTINFGSITGQEFKVDSLAIQNTGNTTLYVEVLRSVSSGGQAAAVLDFSSPPDTVLRDNISTSKFVRFQAVSLAGNPTPGLREALLTITMREGGPTGRIVTQGIYVLRGRVGSVLSAGLPAIDDASGQRVAFDSVYLGQSRMVTVPVRNISPRGITLIDTDAQRILPATQTVYSIVDGGLRRKNYATGDSDAVSLRFLPNRIGTELATYQARYRNEDTAVQSLELRLGGVGVSQSLRLVSAFNNLLPGPVRISGDTVDIGDVRLGLEAPVVITFRNEGNIPLNPASQVPLVLIPSTAPDNIFRITSQFNYSNGVQKNAVAPNADESSLALTFKPATEAEYLMRYTIVTDTRSRIPTAPDLGKIIYIRGRGVQPDIDVAPRTLTFDSVPVTNCLNSKEGIFTITNTGTTPLTCDALSLLPRQPGQGNVLFNFASAQQTTITVPPKSRVDVRMVFTPPTTLTVPVQSFTDTVTITSNAPPPRNIQKVALNATAVQAPAASVAMGSFRAQPGVRIGVPVEVGSAATKNPLTQINTAELRLAYNSTLLRYAGVETINTASAGASTQAVSSTTGVIVNIVGMNETSPSQRRLVTVLFDTYIGTQPQTELALTGVKLGSAACPEIVTITRLSNGSFTPDSVCNLVQKSQPATIGNVFALKAVSNTALGGSSELGFELAFETRVTLTLYNSRGDAVATIIDAVLPAGEYSVPLLAERLGGTGLSAGLYFCRMQADIFHDVKKILIVK